MMVGVVGGIGVDVEVGVWCVIMDLMYNLMNSMLMCFSVMIVWCIVVGLLLNVLENMLLCVCLRWCVWLIVCLSLGSCVKWVVCVLCLSIDSNF